MCSDRYLPRSHATLAGDGQMDVEQPVGLGGHRIVDRRPAEDVGAQVVGRLLAGLALALGLLAPARAAAVSREGGPSARASSLTLRCRRQAS